MLTVFIAHGLVGGLVALVLGLAINATRPSLPS
jgi:hypothetical protein